MALLGADSTIDEKAVFRQDVKMKQLLLGFLLSISLVANAQAADGRDLPLPEENKPWKHPASGLLFPLELESFECGGIFEYEEPALGSVVRYLNEKLRIRADVYVYPCPLPLKTDEDMKNAAREAAVSALGEIGEMKRLGHYTKVEPGEATYDTFDLLPEGSGKSCMLNVPLELNLIEKSDAGEVEQVLRSVIRIFIYRGHWVKLRCTFPKEEDKKLATAVEEFAKKVRRLVFEPGLRTLMQKEMVTYRADPLGEKGREASGSLLSLAEASPVLSLTINERIATLGEDLGDQESKLDILRAYITGAVAASLVDPLPETPDLPQAGAEEVLKVYAQMKKTDPKLQSARLDELAAAVTQKKVAQWLELLPAKYAVSSPLKHRLLTAISDFEVAIIHLELERAEALAVDGVRGVASGPVGPAAAEGAVRLLGLQDLGEKLCVVEAPVIATGLEEGLRLVIPAVEVAVAVPIEWLGGEEVAQKSHALFHRGSFALRQRLQAQQAAAGEAPLIVMLVAVRFAKAALFRLLRKQIVAATVDGAVESVDLEAAVLRGFQRLKLPSGHR